MALSNKIDAGNLELASIAFFESNNRIQDLFDETRESRYCGIRRRDCWRISKNVDSRLFLEKETKKKKMKNIPLSSVISCVKLVSNMLEGEYVRKALTRKAIDT